MDSGYWTNDIPDGFTAHDNDRGPDSYPEGVTCPTIVQAVIRVEGPKGRYLICQDPAQCFGWKIRPHYSGFGSPVDIPVVAYRIVG